MRIKLQYADTDRRDAFWEANCVLKEREKKGHPRNVLLTTSINFDVYSIVYVLYQDSISQERRTRTQQREHVVCVI